MTLLGQPEQVKGMAAAKRVVANATLSTAGNVWRSTGMHLPSFFATCCRAVFVMTVLAPQGMTPGALLVWGSMVDVICRILCCGVCGLLTTLIGHRIVSCCSKRHA